MTEKEIPAPMAVGNGGKSAQSEHQDYDTFLTSVQMEVKDWCDRHQEYGATLAEQAFLQNPDLDPRVDEILGVILQEIRPHLLNRGMSENFVRMCGESAVLGFLRRFHKLTAQRSLAGLAGMAQ
jgi:hypothetical protein